MESRKKRLFLATLGSLSIILLVWLVACAGAEATPTPVPPAKPAQPAAPTAAPQPTATLIPGAPTPKPAEPTPTRTLPTATPSVSDKPQYGGTLRTAYPTSPRSLSGLHPQDFMDQVVNLVIYDSLVEADENFNIVPNLAASWEISADGKIVTFHLRKGVKFQDGTDFNAQTVKWNFESMLDPKFGATYAVGDIFAPAIKTIEAKDEHTVTFNLKKPFRPLLGHMALGYVRMISPSAWQKYGLEEFKRNPAGTGPFKLKEFRAGERVLLERFNDYWNKGKPYLDFIRFDAIPDTAVQIAMLRTGETDVLRDVTGLSVPLLKGNPNVKLVVEKEPGYWFGLFMDTQVEPFKNKALRQAIAYAIDRQAIVNSYLGGYGVAGYSFGVGWYADPNYKPYAFDLQKSKEKLIEARYPDGVTFDYGCMATDIELQLCEIVQALLRKVGINAKITPILAANYFLYARTGKVSFGRTSFAPRPDPDYVLSYFLRCDGVMLKNSVHYCNAETDKLMASAEGVYDIAKAGPMYIQAQKLVLDDAPYITMYKPTLVAGLGRRVQGFVWIPDTMPRYRDLWLER